MLGRDQRWRIALLRSRVDLDAMRHRQRRARPDRLWSGGGAHFLAVGGYRDLPVQYVHVEDPWYGPSDIPFSTLVSGYQGIGTWANSYWTKP